MQSNSCLRIAAAVLSTLIAACDPPRTPYQPLEPVQETDSYKHDDSPATPTSIGAPCSECDGKGQECFPETAGFRDGYCTQTCHQPRDCPGGSICLEGGDTFAYASGCYRTCGPLQPCRAGYECVDINLSQQLCVPGYVPPLPPLPRDRLECANATGATGSVTTETSVTLSEPHGYANLPRIAVEPGSGRVVVAWSHYDDYRHQGVFSVSSSDGGKTFPAAWSSWSNDQLNDAVSNGFTTELSHPMSHSVHLTSVDDVTSLWVSLRQNGLLGPAVTLCQRYDSFHGSEWAMWAPPMTELPYAYGLGADLRAVELAASPTSHAVWLVAAQDAPGQSIILATKRPADEWLKPTATALATKPVDAVRVDRPVIAFHANGTAAVAWVVVRSEPLGSSQNQIWVQRIDAEGAPVGAATVVSTGDSPVRDRPSIAYRGDRLIVAYTSGASNGEWQIRAAIASDGVTFAPSVRVDPEADCSLALHPSLTFETSAAATAEVAVTYYRAIGGTGSVFRTNLAADGTTTTTRLTDWFDLELAAGGSEIAEHLDVVVTGGKRYTTWTQPDATTAHATVRLLIEAVTP